jgi:hypothetical protein
MGLEAAATSLSWYEPEIVPGLLQTREYAHDVLTMAEPGLSADELRHLIEVRCQRQALLTRRIRPLRLQVVLNEAVLHRPVGGSAVMTAQIDQMLSFAALPNVTIRVVRWRTGLHLGVITGPFVILDFGRTLKGDATEPPTVYVDGYTGGAYLDKPREIERHTNAFTRIWDAAEDLATALEEMGKWPTTTI